MRYPGDSINFVLPISHEDGSLPNVTTAPLITILYLGTLQAVVTAAPMTLIQGTRLVYAYAWNSSDQQNGDYLAIVSYAADGNTFNGQFLSKVELGDTNITGTVALDGTVAKDATVAKDQTVAHITDLESISPDQSEAVLAIKAKTDTLPTTPAAQSDVTDLTQFLTDIHDAVLGSWIVDKTQNPKQLSFRRLDGTTLATFSVTEDGNSAARTKTS